MQTSDDKSSLDIGFWQGLIFQAFCAKANCCNYVSLLDTHSCLQR